jgi:hypothetical protein
MNILDELIINLKQDVITLDVELSNIIKITCNDIFKKLNILDKERLIYLAEYLIYIINNKFNITNNSQWYLQNNRDIKGIFLLLLPYIDYNLLENLSSINEIVFTKKMGISKHEDENKQHNVNAKIIETKEKPDVRIESKLDRGKVGEATIKFSNEKGWHVSERSPNRALGESHLKHATYDDPEHPDHGMPVLDFLNKHHPNGKVGQYRYFKAAPGTSEAYFKQTGANYAHIHDVDKDYGTTFTTGDGHELKGKTNLGHLSRAQLEQMNHRIEIHPTTTGTTTMVHRPKRSFMKHLAASATENPSEHGDLSNPEHAKEFLNKAKSALGIKS